MQAKRNVAVDLTSADDEARTATEETADQRDASGAGGGNDAGRPAVGLAGPVSARGRPEGIERLEGSLRIVHATDVPHLSYHGRIEPLAPFLPPWWQRAAVRSFDLLIAVPAFVVLFPVMVVIGIAIAVGSPGPVLFRSRRITRSGRFFDMYKFRTMVVNGDEVLEQYFVDHPEARNHFLRHMKLEVDPRVTRLGRFLRKWSLDEVPQLWNVIRGHMSIVGPRPLLAEEFVRFGGAVDTVVRVKGGLTGLWQVEGRNLLTFEQRVPLDVRYARTRSLAGDIWIIARTLWQLLTRRPGAF